MDKKKYCNLMMNMKSNGCKFGSYMGTRWFMVKAAILFVGVFMVLNDDRVVSVVGYILLGYLLGVVSANIRSFILSKKMWQFQKEVLDWEKIEKEEIAEQKE